jgi:hypothetical protein
MKTLNYLFIALMLISNCLFAQKNNVDKYFLIRPSEIKTKKSEIQKYDVTSKWQNLDAINGNKINCNAVKATYLIGHEDDRVSWKNVSLSRIDDFTQKQFEGTILPSFNDFTYKKYNTDFLK